MYCVVHKKSLENEILRVEYKGSPIVGILGQKEFAILFEYLYYSRSDLVLKWQNWVLKSNSKICTIEIHVTGGPPVLE